MLFNNPLQFILSHSCITLSASLPFTSNPFPRVPNSLFRQIDVIVNSEQCSIPIFSHFSCSKVTLLSPSAVAIWIPISTPKHLRTQLQNRTVYKVISNKQSHSSSNDYFFIEQMRQRQRRHDTTSCAQSFSEKNFSWYTILPI